MAWHRCSRIAFAAVVLLTAPGLIAQSFPGRITGTVRDSGGAVVVAPT